MRGAALLALAVVACVSTPPPTSTPSKAIGGSAVRLPVPEPPPPPPVPPPERAKQIIESQGTTAAPYVTDAFKSVWDDALSGDPDRARSALDVIEEIALRAERMRASQADDFLVGADHLNPLLALIDRILAQLEHQQDCPTFLAVDSAEGQMARVPRGRLTAKGRLVEPGRPMSTRALVCAMRAIKEKVAACYARYQIPGTVLVNFVISKQGTVAAATTMGTFAGTPTGDCVAAAAKTATFPPSDGMTTPYPFVLK